MPRKLKLLLILILLLGLPFFSPEKTNAASAEPQRCKTESPCTVGEFLYDDNYVPIPDAHCTINSKYPDDGGSFLNEDMTIGDGGWYYKTFDAGSTVGTYPTQLCCESGSDYLCIDKTFIVGPSYTSASENANAVWDEATSDHTTAGTYGKNLQNPTLLASEIWESTTRTLTAYGSLASEVWAYSTRSLTTFGNLASDVWSSATRTLTGSSLSSGNIATKSDIDTLTTKINSNTVLIEKVVNKPIITTFMEENDTPKLETKLEDTEKSLVYVSTVLNSARVRTLNVLANWNGLTSDEIAGEIRAISEEADKALTPAGGLKDKWKNPITDKFNSQVKTIADGVKLADSELTLNGKTEETRSTLLLASRYLESAKKLIGGQNEGPNNTSLYGYIAYIKDLAAKLDTDDKEIVALLENWDSYSDEEKTRKLSEVSGDIYSNKEFSLTQKVLGDSTAAPDPKELKNKALALQALINTNKIILAQSSGKPIKNLWLEEGSIIFKALITNPAGISQQVPLKFYLPKEVTRENVLRIDSGLEMKYDTTEEVYYVEGNFDLAPYANKVLAVEVDDVWIISDDELASLKRQTEELFAPLKNTSYFAQGATLKSDIVASLDRVSRLEKDAHTPEAKIKAYRESEIELTKVKGEIKDLTTLATSAGSSNVLFGFVGGSQAFTVWGIVVVLIASFVFLMMYTRAAISRLGSVQSGVETGVVPETPVLKKAGNLNLLKFLSIVLVSSVFTIALNAGVIHLVFHK